MITVSPVVRWVPDGPHAGLYIWVPGIERWQRTEIHAFRDSGVLNTVVRDLPSGAQTLVPLCDAGHAIDFYRDFLRPEDQADGVPHAVARRHALAELSDAADLPLWAPRDGNAERPSDDTRA